MAGASLELPAMLAGVLGGVRRLEVSGATVDEALDDACRRLPGLRVHLRDERGALREHVLCFHNGRDVREPERRTVPLRDGDRLVVLQAVSGG